MTRDPLELWICATLALLFFTALWRAAALACEPRRPYVNPDYMDTRSSLPVLFMCAEYAAALHLLLALGAKARYPGLGLAQAFMTDLMKDADVRGFQRLAESWYAGGAELPLFPAMVRAFALSGNFFAAAVAVNAACCVGAGYFVYRLALLDYDRPTAIRAVKYMYIFPSAFFFAAPLAVNICLFFSAVFIYLVRKRYYGFAAAAGFCAALCDAAGVAAALAAAAEMLGEWRRHSVEDSRRPAIAGRNTKLLHRLRGLSAALPIAGAAAGFGCYLYINLISYGDMFYFLSRRPAYFPRDSWFFWDTAAYLFQQTKVWIDGSPEIAYAISIPNLVCMFVILLLLAAGTARSKTAPPGSDLPEPVLRPSYVLYGLAFFLATFGILGDLNAPRQSLALFPLAISAAALTRGKLADYSLTLVYLLGFAAYFRFIAL